MLALNARNDLALRILHDHECLGTVASDDQSACEGQLFQDPGLVMVGRGDLFSRSGDRFGLDP